MNTTKEPNQASPEAESSGVTGGRVGSSALLGSLPSAWMRRWAYEGIKPYKEKNPETGRMAYARKFLFNEVSLTKLFKDDVPLFAALPNAAVREPTKNE